MIPDSLPNGERRLVLEVLGVDRVALALSIYNFSVFTLSESVIFLIFC